VEFYFFVIISRSREIDCDSGFDFNFGRFRTQREYENYREKSRWFLMIM
jgi:hypothetical protein